MENFKYISNLGSGSYGSVWKAIDRTSKEVVAIKMLEQTYSSIDECINLREVKALLRLINHPNIIHVKQLIFEKNHFFFVFEHMNNNLRQLIKYRDKPLSEAEARRWMLQILQAVEFMHTNGYFHRDLKPENLLVSNNHSVIKVADLGMAREMKSGQPYTSNVATPWYRAPELLLLSSDYGAPMDMWAVGLIMAELFNLRPLFDGKTALDQIYKMCLILGAPTEQTWPDGMKMAAPLGFKFPQTSPCPLSLLIPDASPEAVDLISAMCSWDPSKRPTASEALQHPFFQTHKQPVPLPISRQECQSKVQAAVVKRAVHSTRNKRFGESHAGLRTFASQQGPLAV